MAFPPDFDPFCRLRGAVSHPLSDLMLALMTPVFKDVLWL